MSIADRARVALDVKHYNAINCPEYVAKLKLAPPNHPQNVLRMLVMQQPYDDIYLPSELAWTKPMIDIAVAAQDKMRIRQPFCCLTVRHGYVSSENDDVWHVDGFSMRFNQLPEQNYVWADKMPTEYMAHPIDFPSTFNPLKHNIHTYIQDIVKDYSPENIDSETIYCMDPYVIHRRPKNTFGEWRTFIRISFTPMEIRDRNNTANPLMPVSYEYDGKEDFRDKLVSYNTIVNDSHSQDR